jgi:uncharacterized OB-fold protein
MPSPRPFAVSRCAVCGLSAWPPPAMCRRCGSLEFAPEPAPGGTLEETTESAGPDGPVTLGTVRTGAGPMVVARVVGARPGAEVNLRVREGALEAT